MARGPKTTINVPLNASINLAEQKTAQTGGRMEDKDKRNTDSAAMLPYWEKAADVIGGIESMIAAQAKYLPKFPDENQADYDFRLSLAKLTNIYGDTLESLACKPFAEPVKVKVDGTNDDTELPDEIEEILENIDGGGSDLTKFASEVFQEGINKSIDWIFIDYPKPDPNVKTVADAKAAKIRPYWSRVLAENMLEARSVYVNSQEILIYVRFLEFHDTKRKVREFTNDAGVINWNLYAKQDNGEWISEDSGTLQGIEIIPLVPFMVGRRKGKSFQFDPPLRNALELQITLYRQETALEFTKTMTAYPMLAGNGVKPPMEADGKSTKRLAVGPHRVLYAPPDGMGNSGSWAYVEPGASSLTFLKSDIDTTKQDLRELGKQPLTAQSGNLTVITTAVAAGKARSAVNAWGVSLGKALENALAITMQWMKDSRKLCVSVFDDYDNFAEGALEALASARSNGDLSRQSYLNELKRRQVLSSDFDAEADAEALLNETPSEPGAGELDNPDGLPGTQTQTTTPPKTPDGNGQ